jgi:NAD-dependent SIR2 family protein deacetylase
MPLLDPAVPVPDIDVKDLPHCPSCKTHLLRPGVVWFGEPLDHEMLAGADEWINSGPVDLMLVVGTAAVVWPAAGYVEEARRNGAVVAVINPDPDAGGGLGPEDFFFQGDAAEVLPRLFAKVEGFQLPS